ncbi:hypothetical protein C8Q74DRAFT_707314 [Fomes fomentarius]|nr:hypothetical protein C8Q74DRAFT_707314 [Fomes fomentarius]
MNWAGNGMQIPQAHGIAQPILHGSRYYVYNERIGCWVAILEKLEQLPYVRGQSLMPDSHLPTVNFGSLSLRTALEGHAQGTLVNHDGPAWPEPCRTPQKLAIVFCFPNLPTHTRQYTVHRQGGVPLPRERLAQIVAQQMDTILTAARNSGHPLLWNGQMLMLDDLVLQEVVHATKGSLQPVIAVRL